MSTQWTAFLGVAALAGAGECIEQMLAQEPPAGDVLTVFWHSITRLYWPASETAQRWLRRGHGWLWRTWPWSNPLDRPGGSDKADLSVDGDVIALVGRHGGMVEVGTDR